ncbi:unnamed protein product [Pieris brassicae]|uniref:Uncharacterized protein n=1 Tax=Pieris brassicae TaxID=7116 RepID=A0A9P0TEX6_PIEBR|nr:unnamed protein product [Pieris brassicae]
MTIRFLVLLCCVTFVITKPNNPVYPRTDSANQRNPINIGQNVGTRNPTYPRNQGRPVNVGPNNSANAVAADDSLEVSDKISVHKTIKGIA